MKPSRRWLVLLFSVSFCGLLGGCEQMWHNLHPDQMWKLNRGPDIGSVDASFSISDDDATIRSRELRRQMQQPAGLHGTDAFSE